MNKTPSIIPRMVLLVAGLAAAAIASAQPAVTPTNPAAAAPGSGPRIGLALSGGGARGIAHVGVLKVLEEMRIPSLRHRHQHGRDRRRHLRRRARRRRELEKLVLAADWDEIFRDQPPRDEIADPAQGRRLQDAVRAGVRRQGRRARAAQGRHRRRLDRVVLPRAGAAGDRASPTSRKLPIPFRAMAHRHRDRRIGRARPRQRRAGDARQHVGAGRDRARRDRRPAAGRRRHRQQPADRRGAQAVRRRRHRRQHLDAAVEARGASRRRCPSSAQLINFLGKQTVDAAAEEPGRQGRADRARPGRHLGGQFERSADAIRDRRGGDARDGRRRSRATACRPSSTRRCARRRSPRAKALGTVDEIRVEGLERTNPEVLRAPGREQARRAAVRGEGRRRPAPHLRRAATSRASATASSAATAVRARWSSSRRKSRGGRDYLRFGLGARERLPGRQPVQPAGPVPAGPGSTGWAASG